MVTHQQQWEDWSLADIACWLAESSVGVVAVAAVAGRTTARLREVGTRLDHLCKVRVNVECQGLIAGSLGGREGKSVPVLFPMYTLEVGGRGTQ